MALKFNLTKDEDIHQEAKTILFSRWLTTNYTSQEMNSFVGIWWVQGYRYFDEMVFPNYKENGSFSALVTYIKEQKRQNHDLPVCSECGEPINFGRTKCEACSYKDLPF